MSIEKGLSTGCTPAECNVHKRTCKNYDKKGDNNFTYHRSQLTIPKTMTVAHSSLIVLLSTTTLCVNLVKNVSAFYTPFAPLGLAIGWIITGYTPFVSLRL